MTEDELFQMGLLKICQTMRMSSIGAANPLPDDEENAMRSYLYKRLGEWKPSTDRISAPYDNTVKQLIEDTIREVGIRAVMSEQRVRR